MIPPPQIDIVVVSYNTRSLLLECLASVLESTQEIAAEIIVVDNDSQDGSPEAVREQYPRLHLIINHVNVGFGAACNQAIQETASPLILLLNSDARLTPESFRVLYETVRTHERCGAVGCRLLDDNGQEMVNTRNFLTPFNQALELTGMAKYFRSRRLSRTYRPNPNGNRLDCSVDWIDGACLLVKRAALMEVGLFDEQFFMYSEDEDLCWRLKQHGWSICYSAAALAFHRGGGSSTTARQELLLSFYFSQLLFLDKHRGRTATRIYTAAMSATLLLKSWFRRATPDSEPNPEMAERLRALRQAYSAFTAQRQSRS